MENMKLSGLDENGELSDGGQQNEDWTVLQRKGKKKKKNRTLSLQTFFSENNSGNGTPNGSGTPGDGPFTLELPELNGDELLIQTSLLTFFSDVLKRLGPVKIGNEKLAREIGSLSEEGKLVIEKCGGLAYFLAQSPDISNVDHFFCSKEDLSRAQTMAIELIMNNIGPDVINNRSSLNTPNKPSVASIVSQPPQQNVWKNRMIAPIGTQSNNVSNNTPTTNGVTSNNNFDQVLQLPKVDSLFSYNNQDSALTGLPLGPPNTTNLSVPPPPIHPKPISPPAPMKNGLDFTNVPPPTSSLTGLGPVGIPAASSKLSQSNSNISSPSHSSSPVIDDMHLHNTIESLNKRLHGLSMANTELLKQLGDKENQVQNFTKLIGPQTELYKNHEKLKEELEEKKKECELLKKALPHAAMNGEQKSVNSNSSSAENQLIISLQKQLEGEKLNSSNLKKQLDIERSHSRALQERLNQLTLLSSASAQVGRNRAVGGLPEMGSAQTGNGTGIIGTGSGLNDSFGLRSLLANTSSVFSSIGGPQQQQQPASSTLNSISSMNTGDTLSSFSGVNSNSIMASVVPTTAQKIPSTAPLKLPVYNSSTLAEMSFNGVHHQQQQQPQLQPQPSQQHSTIIQVFEELKRSFPNLSDDQIQTYIKTLRMKYGKLSVFSVSQIVIFVSEIIAKEGRR